MAADAFFLATPDVRRGYCGVFGISWLGPFPDANHHSTAD
jgi:hypothetical protein